MPWTSNRQAGLAGIGTMPGGVPVAGAVAGMRTGTCGVNSQVLENAESGLALRCDISAKKAVTAASAASGWARIAAKLNASMGKERVPFPGLSSLPFQRSKERMPGCTEIG